MLTARSERYHTDFGNGYCDLYFADITLSQGHHTPFGQGQQLCEYQDTT